MAIFRDANLNIIDTTGSVSPSSAAHNPTPDYASVPASLNASVTATTDFQYVEPTTKAAVADRA